MIPNAQQNEKARDKIRVLAILQQPHFRLVSGSRQANLNRPTVRAPHPMKMAPCVLGPHPLTPTAPRVGDGASCGR